MQVHKSIQIDRSATFIAYNGTIDCSTALFASSHPWGRFEPSSYPVPQPLMKTMDFALIAWG